MTDYNWHDYSVPFSKITTRFQIEVYEKVALYLFGSVVDCGCGAGKLIPYLTANTEISGYLGIDLSEPMLGQAELIIGKLGLDNYSVQCQKIEDMTGSYSSAVSIQSYYSWPDTEEALRAIYNALGEGGVFVLGTVNEKLNLEKMISIAEQELLLNDMWDEFKENNRSLASAKSIKLPTLDELIAEVRDVGFKVIDVDTSLYLGGLNLLVLKK